MRKSKMAEELERMKRRNERLTNALLNMNQENWILKLKIENLQMKLAQKNSRSNQCLEDFLAELKATAKKPQEHWGTCIDRIEIDEFGFGEAVE